MEPPSAPTSSPSPVAYVLHIGKSGQDTLWATYFIFVLATLFISILAARLHAKDRALHLVALVMAAVTALSYYAMATHSGVSYVSKGLRTVQGEERLVLRQVFWARYVNWAIGNSLILFTFSLLAGLPWVDVVLLIFAGEGVALSATFGALLEGHESAKWGWYGHTCFFTLLTLLTLFRKGRQCAKQQHEPVYRLYAILAFSVVPLAIFGLVTFALGEGAGVIDINTEIIAYAVFDIFTKAVFSVWIALAYTHKNQETHVAPFSDAWIKVRGRQGKIQLPVSIVWFLFFSFLNVCAGVLLTILKQGED